MLFDCGDELTLQAREQGIRFLLVSGKPIEEPVARYGPIVMNTQEQLRQAFRELGQGTFLKPESRIQEGCRPQPAVSDGRRSIDPPEPKSKLRLRIGGLQAILSHT